jgi:hypothetical protein
LMGVVVTTGWSVEGGDVAERAFACSAGCWGFLFGLFVHRGLGGLVLLYGCFFRLFIDIIYHRYIYIKQLYHKKYILKI